MYMIQNDWLNLYTRTNEAVGRNRRKIFLELMTRTKKCGFNGQHIVQVMGDKKLEVLLWITIVAHLLRMFPMCASICWMLL